MSGEIYGVALVGYVHWKSSVEIGHGPYGKDPCCRRSLVPRLISIVYMRLSGSVDRELSAARGLIWLCHLIVQRGGTSPCVSPSNRVARGQVVT